MILLTVIPLASANDVLPTVTVVVVGVGEVVITIVNVIINP